MSESLNRRTLVRAVGAMLAAGVLPAKVVASGGALAPGAAWSQDASPAASPSLLDTLGLPVVELVVTREGITLPATVAAGPMLLVGRNETDGFLTVELAQLPVGITVDEFITASSSEDGAIPEWAIDAVLAGGLQLPPMSDSRIGVLLDAGEYTAIAYGEAAVASPSSTFTVNGSVNSDAADAVGADLVVNLGAYTFDIPDTVAGGPQVWRVSNTHDVFHHVVAFGVDRLYTPDEVVAGLVADFTATPAAAGAFSFEAAEFAFSSPPLSGGRTIWIEPNLEPGYYVALCFLPDPGADLPHAVSGMIDAFEVA